ncbi:flagellar FlhE [Halomonas alkaliantarctica]|nr:flagellar FlhE [Halomonas alkaliantarctica]
MQQHTQRKRWASLLVLFAALFVGNVAVASGSWVAEVPGMMVAMSDRQSTSRRAAPPPGAPVQGGEINRIQWRYQHPPGQPVNAWLCQAERCTALTGMRGSTQAFAGERASESLHFRFTLPAGEPPVRVQGMQVIVNYQ